MKKRTGDDWPIPLFSINSLPLFALVGFAGRCARRIHPAVLHACPKIHREQAVAIEQAISLAELAASKHASLPENVNLAADSAMANDEAISVAVSARQSTRTFAAVPQAALIIVAGNSAALAADTVAAARAGDRENTVKSAANCAEVAGAILAPTPRRDALINAMLDDLDILKEDHARGTLTEMTPVPPQYFGKLWKEGPPRGWPSLSD